MAAALDAKLTRIQKGIVVDYTVQSGDTLYTIAHQYRVPIHDILTANHLDRKSVIKKGQILHIPLDAHASASRKSAPELSAAAKGTVMYTVQSGDTFYTIARSHHTSIDALLKANNLDRHAVIKAGQHLTVPVNTYFSTEATGKGTKTKQTASAPSGTKDATEANASPVTTYTVQRGDTLFSIARKNHLVISKLMQYNHMNLTDQLHIGQVLKITSQNTFVDTKDPAPRAAGTPEKKKLPVGAMPSYTVKKGDTLWRIAQKHHLTLAQIRKLNRMKKRDRIHVGMVLAVGKAVQPERKTYTVKKGDTLWLIARKNHLTTKQLRKLNGLHRKDRIRVGMVLALTEEARPAAYPLSDRSIIAQLKKRGIKKDDIAAVLARIRKSRKKKPSIAAILAQIKKEKKQKAVQTPLRVAASKRKGRSRTSRARGLLNGSRDYSHWSARNRVIRIAKRYLGRRYVWGAQGPHSFDCSGFTRYVMRKSKGIRLPRVSRKQAYYGKYISRSHLRPGDLIFFDTSRRRRGYINHVGIYIGNHKFIHASSARHRVVITSLNQPFYSARFKWGRRVN